VRELNSRLITALPGRTRMRVTWHARRSWLARLLMPGLPTEVTGVYERHGETWRTMDGDEVNPAMIPALTKIEQRLLRDPELAEDAH
jgi:hypothetical protein